MKTQSKPKCAFCKKSAGVQFNIFTPRFAPFGTACVECETTIPAHIKTVADWTPEAQAAATAATSETAARRVQFEADLAALVSSITGKARRQFEYHETTNIPDRIVEPDRSVISPVPLAMASLKVRERLEAIATPVAPSAGEKERTVGAVVSAKAVRKS